METARVVIEDLERGATSFHVRVRCDSHLFKFALARTALVSSRKCDCSVKMRTDRGCTPITFVCRRSQGERAETCLAIRTVFVLTIKDLIPRLLMR